MLVSFDSVCRDERQMAGASGFGCTLERLDLVAQTFRLFRLDFIFAGSEFHLAEVDDMVGAFDHQVYLSAAHSAGRSASPF